MKRARQKSDKSTRKRARGDTSVYWLPPEIWVHVISFLHPKKDRWRVSLVCKAWSELVWDAFDPSFDDSTIDDYRYGDYWAVRAASARGCVKAVARFLDDKRVDCDRACDVAMEATFSRSSRGHCIPIMKLCLELGRGTLSLICNDLLPRALAYDSFTYIELIRLLVADNRVNPAARGNAALLQACAIEYPAYSIKIEDSLKIVQLILSDSRVNPLERNCKAIRLASKNGNADTLMMLLADDRVRADLSVDTDRALLLACENGHLEVVRVLLENGRANPAVICGPATWTAQKNGHTDVAKLLDAHVLGELD